MNNDSSFLLNTRLLFLFLIILLSTSNAVCLLVCFGVAALGLRCCTRASSSCSEWGLLFIAVRGLLIAVASLIVGHRL